jgi:hypothetical protein
LIFIYIYIFICLCYKITWGHSVRGPKFGARNSGPEVRGPKFGARLLWYRYTKKYLIILLEITYMNFFSTKLPGGHPIRGPGSDACGIGMPKIIWLHHYYLYICVFTCLWYKITWGHAVRGPSFVAQVCQKIWNIIKIRIYVFLYAFATKLPGGTPFGA